MNRMRNKVLVAKEDRTTFGSRIREVRERAGYATPTELWKAIEERGDRISLGYIRQIERGKSKPSRKALNMILGACDVITSDFIGTDLTIKEDATLLAARVRQARERAGYTTPGQLWKAIHDRGGNITRQYLYQLEHGKSTASLQKLMVILDTCGMTMADFLGTDLIIGPRRDTNMEERKLVTMITKIRSLNPTLTRVIESAVISAHQEVLKLSKQQQLKLIATEHSTRPRKERK